MNERKFRKGKSASMGLFGWNFMLMFDTIDHLKAQYVQITGNYPGIFFYKHLSISISFKFISHIVVLSKTVGLFHLNFFFDKILVTCRTPKLRGQGILTPVPTTIPQLSPFRTSEKGRRPFEIRDSQNVLPGEYVFQI